MENYNASLKCHWSCYGVAQYGNNNLHEYGMPLPPGIRRLHCFAELMQSVPRRPFMRLCVSSCKFLCRGLSATTWTPKWTFVVNKGTGWWRCDGYRSSVSRTVPREASEVSRVPTEHLYPSWDGSLNEWTNWIKWTFGINVDNDYSFLSD